MSAAAWYLLGVATGAAGPAAWLSCRHGINPFTEFHAEIRKRFSR